MLIKFRNGIVQHQKSPLFLTKSSGGVTLNCSGGPLILTFADGSSNYLLVNSETIKDAWGGRLDAKKDHYLYIEIDKQTGLQKFGHSEFPCAHGPVLPNKATVGQNYFEYKSKKMYERLRGYNSWKEVLRVFVGEYRKSAILKQYPVGSNVNIFEKNYSGMILFDDKSTPLRKSGTNQFVTTEDEFTNPSNKIGKIDQHFTELKASHVIPKHYCINVEKFGTARIAKSGLECIGIALNSAGVGETINYTNVGELFHPTGWGFSGKINTILYVGENGDISEQPAKYSIQQVGKIIDSQTVLIDIGERMSKVFDFARSPTATPTPTRTPTPTPSITSTMTPTTTPTSTTSATPTVTPTPTTTRTPTPTSTTSATPTMTPTPTTTVTPTTSMVTSNTPTPTPTSTIAVAEPELLLGGQFYDMNARTLVNNAKIDTNGNVIDTFSLDLNADVPNTHAIQNDGKILVSFYNSNSFAGTSYLRRFNSDGTLDNTFDCAISGSQVNVIMPLSDGSILISGYFDSINNTPKFGFAKLNSFGELDLSFFDLIFDYGPSIITVLNNNKIVVGGLFNDINGISRTGVARLNSDGTIDETFNANIDGSNVSMRGIVELPSDKLLIVGDFPSTNGGINVTGGAIVVDVNGDLDPLVDMTAVVGTNIILGCAVQTSGKMILFLTDNITNDLVRLNTDGSLDGTFQNYSTEYVLSDPYQNQLLILPDDSIAINGGINITPDFYVIAKLTDDGYLDNSFLHLPINGSGIYNKISYLNPVSPGDPEFLVSGYFEVTLTTLPNYAGLSKIEGSSNRYDYFHPIIDVDTNYVYLADIQTDGKVIANILNDFGNVIRYNLDGSVDNTFECVHDGSQLSFMKALSNGKIIIAGDFTEINSVPVQKIARLD